MSLSNINLKKYLKPSYILILILVCVILYLIYIPYIPYIPYTLDSQHQIYSNPTSDILIIEEPKHYKKIQNSQQSQQSQQSQPIQYQSPFPPTYTDDVEDSNIMRNSYWNYTNRKAMERVANPLLPPERSYVQNYGVPINVPTRGLVGGYQQVGMLYKDDIANPDKKPGNNSDSTVIALYGRPVDTSRNKWTYYATGDGFQAVKIPITYKGRKCDSEFGCEEITSSDDVAMPPYNGTFKAEIYDYDKPRYIPSVW